ncbi:hypothetical protein B0H13DRAFT_2305703 [Mycena leptocephala]|nr:hypothetical protein B0H13DRAFT_2305703 [Mycena leptocephala]
MKRAGCTLPPRPHTSQACSTSLLFLRAHIHSPCSLAPLPHNTKLRRPAPTPPTHAATQRPTTFSKLDHIRTDVIPPRKLKKVHKHGPTPQTYKGQRVFDLARRLLSISSALRRHASTFVLVVGGILPIPHRVALTVPHAAPILPSYLSTPHHLTRPRLRVHPSGLPC